MTEEPTVLDFFKSLLRGKLIPIPPAEKPGNLDEDVSAPQIAGDEILATNISPAGTTFIEVGSSTADRLTTATGEGGAKWVDSLQATRVRRTPWLALGATGLALLAQVSLEPRPGRAWEPGLVLYFLSAMLLVWAIFKGQWISPPLPEQIHPDQPQPSTVRWRAFSFSLLWILLAFWFFRDNRYTFLNVFLWVLATISLFYAFWLGEWELSQIWARLRTSLRLPWKINITFEMLLAFVVIGMVIFFRVYRLESVPPQMNSDHAEKLLDVWDVLNGQYNIFFPRNTGREDFQMYLTATIVEFFDTGISFMSLKIGTVLAGLLTLPYIYLLGKEIGGKRAGWLALLLAGIAYWPNVISRIGLRFTLYSLFTAPTLYYLIRGLHRRRRNDLLLSGLFLGLGLHGYSPFRVVPIVVLAAFGIYFLHRQSKGARRQVFWWLAALVAISIVVFLPLLRFALENPDLFSSRMFSRMGSIEQPLPGPAGIIFLQNLWRALVMFFWENGEVWVVSVPYRPALDIVSAPLFFLGMILLSIRYIRQRYWVDLFLLISIPLLMLPSILALAFPSENPILNRTAGALVPVFVIAGIGLDRFIASLEKSRDEVQHPPRLFGLGNTVLLLLIGMAALHNYDLVFHQYQRGYELSSWNTTEMGQVIRTFGQFSGTTETAWVVAYPHWVDTRLVGINAGMPTRDLAIWPDRLAETQADLRPKLFLVKPEDQAGLDTLRQLYPLGILQTYDSPIEGKDFLMFLVPAR